MAEDNESLKPIKLICKDCKKPFTYTIWEQKLFGQRGWAQPKRCPACRQRRKILKKSLEDGVSISDMGLNEEKCAMCGRDFFTAIKVKQNEKVYCPDCWNKIKIEGISEEDISKTG